MGKFVQKFRKGRDQEDDSYKSNQRKKNRRAERTAASHNKRDWFLDVEDSPGNGTKYAK